ncbi:HAD family hydrolase [Streptomyces sp. NPDC057939]|uniref:HAD family hydrolase n=1 Tax=Streptomyces sp. NPDC057939 TaxID=3346284 RepID=UPI0036EE7CE6
MTDPSGTLSPAAGDTFTTAYPCAGPARSTVLANGPGAVGHDPPGTRRATAPSKAGCRGARSKARRHDAIVDTAPSDDVEQGKPAPEPVRRALDLAGVAAERAVFVGASAWDMEPVTRSGVMAVGPLCGGVRRADLETAGALTVYSDPASLLTRRQNSPFRRIPAG